MKTIKKVEFLQMLRASFGEELGSTCAERLNGDFDVASAYAAFRDAHQAQQGSGFVAEPIRFASSPEEGTVDMDSLKYK